MEGSKYIKARIERALHTIINCHCERKSKGEKNIELVTELDFKTLSYHFMHEIYCCLSGASLVALPEFTTYV